MGRYHISVSRAKEYMRCPAMYYFKKVYRPKLPFSPAAWTARGSALHNALMDWEKSDRSIDISKIFVDEYDKKIEEFKELQPDYNLWTKTPMVHRVVTDIDLRRKDGLKQIEQYKDYALESDWEVYKDDNDEPFVERDFKYGFNNPYISQDLPKDLLEIWGSIDIIIIWPDGTLQVVDFKTGNKGESNFQVGTYGMIARDHFNLRLDSGYYYYTKSGTKGKNVDVSKYTHHYMAKYYFAVADDMDKSYERKFYPANPSPDNCKFCPAIDLCIEGVK